MSRPGAGFGDRRARGSWCGGVPSALDTGPSTACQIANDTDEAIQGCDRVPQHGGDAGVSVGKGSRVRIDVRIRHD